MWREGRWQLHKQTKLDHKEHMAHMTLVLAIGWTFEDKKSKKDVHKKEDEDLKLQDDSKHKNVQNLCSIKIKSLKDENFGQEHKFSKRLQNETEGRGSDFTRRNEEKKGFFQPRGQPWSSATTWYDLGADLEMKSWVDLVLFGRLAWMDDGRDVGTSMERTTSQEGDTENVQRI